MPDEVKTEQHHVAGEKLLQTVKRLVHEGNVRRIIIKNEEGRTLIEVPLTVGVVGAFLLPVWVAIGAIAAVAAKFTIEVEKADDGPPKADEQRNMPAERSSS